MIHKEIAFHKGNIKTHNNDKPFFFSVQVLWEAETKIRLDSQ